jgi:hypothetical protein
MVSRACRATVPCWRNWQQALLGGCCLLAGCGPSFEVLAEGDLRFAHCDRLDLDPAVGPAYRLECWREWRESYTYGQTRDRVEYAQRRIAEVVSGDSSPPFRLPSGTPGLRRHQSANPSEPHLGKHAAALSGSKSDSGAPSALPRAAESASERSPDGASRAVVASQGPAAVQANPALKADPICRSRCQAESSSCLPGCETKPRGCEPCAPRLASCLRDCGATE